MYDVLLDVWCVCYTVRHSLAHVRDRAVTLEVNLCVVLPQRPGFVPQYRPGWNLIPPPAPRINNLLYTQGFF